MLKVIIRKDCQIILYWVFVLFCFHFFFFFWKSDKCWIKLISENTRQTDPFIYILIGCFYNGRYYSQGQSFPAIDGCNTCFCSGNNNIGCTLVACCECLLCVFEKICVCVIWLQHMKTGTNRHYLLCSFFVYLSLILKLFISKLKRVIHAAKINSFIIIQVTVIMSYFSKHFVLEITWQFIRHFVLIWNDFF